MKRLTLFKTLVIVNLFAVGCSNKQGEKSAVIEKYPVTSPVIIDTTYALEYVSDIQSVQNVELRTRVKGFIEKIYVDEGKPVKAGQLLFSISNKEYMEDLLKANAELKEAVSNTRIAELELIKAKALLAKKIVSKAEIDMIEAKYEAEKAKIDAAKSSVATTKLNLSFTSVKAPFSGVINRISNKAGSLVEEGALLTTLSNNREVFAYFNVSEKEYLDFTSKGELLQGSNVKLLLANNQEYTSEGTIETVESEIDQNTGNLAFRARFPNPNLLLKHGSGAKIVLNKKLSGELVIPQKATFEVQDKLNVFVIDKNNTVQVRTIVPKLRVADLYVVESGLSTNDNILYEGIQLVKDGEKITPKYIQWKPASSKVAAR